MIKTNIRTALAAGIASGSSVRRRAPWPGGRLAPWVCNKETGGHIASGNFSAAVFTRMSKHERMELFVAGLGADSSLSLHPCYQGYFRCFNEGRYYEAHDVLEHLWLGSRGDANFLFYKGLIQIAGAFVHLQKQYLRPDHAKDGRRLRPACRLFALGLANLEPFLPQHLALDLDALFARCRALVAEIVQGDFLRNPWSPDRAPTLHLIPGCDLPPTGT